jgi:RNA polymerase sigma factor (sigma-70 family)
MVLHLCRNILGNEADAEDAFQATFLVLAQRAGVIRQKSSVASWLHGVAYRIALKAQAQSVRRQRHWARTTGHTSAVLSDDLTWREVQQALHAELERLSERYRAPLVLCYLEGKTQHEAAVLLGVSRATVKKCLESARALLRVRLVRRGLGPAAVLAGAAWPAAVSATVSSVLVASTAKVATEVAAGHAAASVISTKVAALSEGVMKAMLLYKLKTGVAAILVLGMICAGGMLRMHQLAGAQHDPADTPFTTSKMGQNEGGPGKDKRADEVKVDLASHFKHRVPFEIGPTETKEGGRIEIQEVWGTRPQIEVGGSYLVRGKYVLPPGQRGALYFFATAGGDWGRVGTIMDLQHTILDKEKGEFTLMHGMAGPGYFHLYLASPDRYSQMFANVYFGTGDNVWRKKE